MKRRLVHVRIFGDGQWREGKPHWSALGFLISEKTFTPIYVEDHRDGSDFPPGSWEDLGNVLPNGKIALGRNMGLFDGEAAGAVDISKLDAKDIPQPVRIMLAKAALLGEEMI